MISSVKGNIKNAYAMAYHAVYYANGTKCDVTGYPRTAIAKVRAMAQASLQLLSQSLGETLE